MDGSAWEKAPLGDVAVSIWSHLSLPASSSTLLIGGGALPACLPGETHEIAPASLEDRPIDIPRGLFAVTANLGGTIDPLTLAERVGSWMLPGAHWLIQDRFWESGRADAPESAFRLDEFLLFAKRMGLVPIEQVAAPSRSDATANEPGLIDLYLLLKKEREPAYAIGWGRKSDEAGLLGLFQASFGHVMTAERWRWKYRNADHLGTMVKKDGEMVAFYGGMPRPIVMFGRQALAVQIGDVMVHPGERGRLGRTGAFFLSTACFLERSIGIGRRYVLGFGFPSEIHMRLSERLRLYAQVDRIMEIVWSDSPLGKPWWLEAIAYDPDKHAALADGLWREMVVDYGSHVIPIRDAAYLRGRYCRHPEHEYRLMLVRHRLFRRVRGLLVVRAREEELQLVDIIGPRRNHKFLVAAALDWARAAGFARVTMWLTSNFADELARETGGTVRESGISVPANVWTPHPPVEEIRGKWWLTAGDADFT